MPVGKTKTFDLALRTWPCQRKAVQALSRHRVSVPAAIPLPLHEVLFLTQINGPLQNKARVALEQTLSGKFPISVGPKNVLLDLAKHRDRETMVNLPVDRKELQAELEGLFKNGEPLYEGRKVFHDLLVITEHSPDRIKLDLNPHFSAYHEPEFYSTAPNLRRNIRTLTYGFPHEAVKDIVEGDLETVVNILSKNHPEAVRSRLAAGEFDSILLHQEDKCLQKILRLLATAVIKMEKVFSSDKLGDIYPFLPPSATKEIASHFNEADSFRYLLRPCMHADKVRGVLSEKREEVLEILKTARSDMQQILGLTLEDIRDNKLPAADRSKLRDALGFANRNNLLGVLPPSYADHVARYVSEAQRSRILQNISKSNLVETVKEPLLHILAEKEYILISMFSFTSTVLAAAVLASMRRGARIRVLLDRREAGHSSSQYENLVKMHTQFARDDKEPAIRLYSGGTQHEKNIIFGSGVAITGSLNWTDRGFTSNLESFTVIRDRNTVRALIKEFDETFGASGMFVLFPEEILAQHWINRAGLVGIRFTERTPFPPEVANTLNFFARWKAGDFRKIKNILDIAAGKKFKIVADLSRSFSPFMSEIKDPVIASFLTRFLEEVPLQFSFAAASSTGRTHPGTTTGLSGLIEHEYIAAEIAVMLCKALGRADLVDQALFSIIIHDAFKNAWETPEGNIEWGRYNPAHGHLAARKMKEFFETLDRREKKVLAPLVFDAEIAAAEHMSIFNRPETTPLIPEDPTLKFIVVLADMLSSRKYLHVRHRAILPMEMDEVLHLYLNNSFSIEGEALAYLSKDKELFAFIREAALTVGHRIASYADLPLRTKKLLRVAESLCDLFPEIKEVRPGRRKELSEEETTRAQRRNEVLAAALLYGTMRYTRGVEDPASKGTFEKGMQNLLDAHPGPASKQNRILTLMLEVDRKMSDPHRADLKPADDPALWVICVANCMMTDPDTKIITVDEVEHYLAKAEEPRTIWRKKRFTPAAEENLLAGVRSLALTEHTSKFLPILEKELLEKLNSRRKDPLQSIHPDVLLALVDKFDCISAVHIYEHLYRPLSSAHRKNLIEEIREASVSEKAREEIVQRIQDLEAPDNPTSVFRIMAQTALANGVKTISQLREETLAASENIGPIAEYGYFKEMDKAVDHVFDRIGTDEKVLIYGDYDVDGQTGTAILTKTLRWIRAKQLSRTMDSKEAQRIAEETIAYYIPHRLNEGYGLNAEALERIHRRGFKTIITTDCGIKDRELVARAKALGIDVIITDHHEPEKKDLPTEAVAILNPKLDLAPDHPAYGLPGAAVAYKLARALVDRLNQTIAEEWSVDKSEILQAFGKIDRSWQEFFIDPKAESLKFKPDVAEALIKSARLSSDKKKKLLDLYRQFRKAGIELGDHFLDSVAAAAVADIVPMTGEVRAIVRKGLEILNSAKKNSGLSAVIKAQHIERVDEEALAFFVAPLLNGAGRFGAAYEGLDLLMAYTEKQARASLSKMFSYLEDRREIEQAIFADAEEQLKFDPESDAGIAVAGEWHKGIIGIVASKLVSRYGVPSVTIGTTAPSPLLEEEPAYGSMRSIKGISAINILRRCAKTYKKETGEELFRSFGGHAGAAGFKLDKERIADFQRIYAGVTRAVVKSRRERMVVAGTLLEGQISLPEVKFFKDLLSPFGSAFEEPRFLVPAKIKKWQVFGKDQQHIRGTLEKGTEFVIFFGNQPWIKRVLMKKKARFVVKLNINAYKGRETVNLIVEDVKSYPKNSKRS